MRTRAVLALVAVAAAATGSCVRPMTTPARSDATYEDKATGTVDELSGVLAVVGIVAGASEADLTSAYASVLLSQAEDAAGAAVDTFASIQPPDGAAAAALRADVVRVGGEVVDLLAELRIAARRGDVAPLLRRAPDVDALLAELEGLP